MPNFNPLVRSALNMPRLNTLLRRTHSLLETRCYKFSRTQLIAAIPLVKSPEVGLDATIYTSYLSADLPRGPKKQLYSLN